MVTVFGLGFVGLTTALSFAHMGVKVYGLDVDAGRKETLRSGHIPFLEPYMEDVLRQQLDRNFVVTDDEADAIRNSEYVFYCVGTPYGRDGSADLTYLFGAIDQTVEAIADDKFRVLVTKSTIPPSTTAEKIAPYIRGKGDVAMQLGVANNPEFLREGHCWEDVTHADRIVLGCNDDRSKQMLVKLYEPMGIPIKCVSHTTGEFIKYLSNTLLATLISYSNEMAQIADHIGDIDVADAFHILHMVKRWNNCNMTSYVYPGCGYGGYCLPKDTAALYAQSCEKGYDPQILRNVIDVNTHRPTAIARKIVEGLPAGSVIGIYGLSFKPDSDDVRDTPAARVIRELIETGYNNIVAYDPAAEEEFTAHYPDLKVIMCSSMKEVYEKSDVGAILTAWPEFKQVPGFGNKPLYDCRYMM